MRAKSYTHRVFRLAIYILVSSFFLCPLVFEIKADQKIKIYDDLFSISFPSENEGWASGRWGCILYTADGGKTWVRQNTGTDLSLMSVFFVDTKQGWAVGEGGIIIHTTDGGKTWEKQKSPVPFFHMKVYFVSPLRGWVVSEQTHILYTEDGGKTWSIQFKDQDFILKSISFCDALHGWAVGEYGFIYHTRNGGRTWEKQGGSFGFSEKTGDVEGGNFLFDVVAIDSETAWAVGIDSYVIWTGNKGKSWHEVSIGGSKTHLFVVRYDPKTKMILLGGNGIFMTSTDKGRTWKIPDFDPPVIYDWIYGIAQRAEDRFILVGGSGMIYQSSGKNLSTWKRLKY